MDKKPIRRGPMPANLPPSSMKLGSQERVPVLDARKMLQSKQTSVHDRVLSGKI